ncbi:M64 family metallopeptidase [Roseateles sp. DB2]|uniref:M64 family metallopeptidase n=1 Tax=Roseateles sp. DB2 TaxID=3453717 RepID=UPI003EEDB092
MKNPLAPRQRLRAPLLLALPLILASAAQAEDLLLRLRHDPLNPAAGLQLSHVEKGRFASQSHHSEPRDGDLVLIARDAKGQELFRRTVGHPSRQWAEVFNPATGQIQQARALQRDGSVELRLPWSAQVQTVDILEHSSQLAARSALAGATPLKRLGRTELDQLAAHSTLSSAQRSLSTTLATPTGSTALWSSGASSQRMDIVLIGDGYASADQSKWVSDAQKINTGILADPLFARYKNSINIRRVDIVSPQSGVSEGGVTRNTALGTVIGCYGIDRLVCADENKVFAAVGSVTAADARDVIIVVANSTTYGGAGGNIGTMTMHPQSIEIALHEIGHTAFKLADEYEYGTCDASSEPGEANVTRASTRSTAKWGSLISSSTAVPTQPGSYANGTVGLFAGAKYCTSGLYRPTENSRMRALGQPWHVVNEARAGQVFNSYTGGSDTSGGAVTVNGSLSGTGASATYPSGGNGYHQSTAGGAFTLKLSGPAGTDFDLYLYKWNGSAWAVVAKSEGSASTESVSYNGTAGYYYAQVKSYAGSGAFTLSYTFPK